VYILSWLSDLVMDGLIVVLWLWYRRGTVTYGLHVGLLFCIHALFGFKYHGGLISSHSDLHIFRYHGDLDT